MCPGQDENVMFLASKLFISGKRVSAKAQLNQMQALEEGRMLFFDAVPCDPNENGECLWFATVVWKGRKPEMEYDDVQAARNKHFQQPRLSDIRQVLHQFYLSLFPFHFNMLPF